MLKSHANVKSTSNVARFAAELAERRPVGWVFDWISVKTAEIAEAKSKKSTKASKKSTRDTKKPTILKKSIIESRRSSLNAADNFKTNMKYMKFCANRPSFDDNYGKVRVQKENYRHFCLQMISSLHKKQSADQTALNSYRQLGHRPWNDVGCSFQQQKYSPSLQIIGQNPKQTPAAPKSTKSTTKSSSVFSEADFASWDKDRAARDELSQKRKRLRL